MSRYRPHPGGVLELACSWPFVPGPVVFLPAAALATFAPSVAPVWRVIGAVLLLVDLVIVVACALVYVDVQESGLRVRNCFRTVLVPFDGQITLSVNEHDTTKSGHTWKSGLLVAYGKAVPTGSVQVQATTRLRYAKWERLRAELTEYATPHHVRFDHDYNAKYAERWHRKQKRDAR